MADLVVQHVKSLIYTIYHINMSVFELILTNAETKTVLADWDVVEPYSSIIVMRKPHQPRISDVESDIETIEFNDNGFDESIF